MLHPLRRAIAGALTIILLSAGADASAHIVLAERTAPAGGYFKVVLRVPHGCDGATTTGLEVAIPHAVLVAKPMVKPGWQIVTKDEALTTPAMIEGHPRTRRVAVITWRQGTLPDTLFDEFAFLVRLPAQAGALTFPVIQTCGGMTVRWTDAPAAGARHPAPVLTLVPQEPAR